MKTTTLKSLTLVMSLFLYCVVVNCNGGSNTSANAENKTSPTTPTSPSSQNVSANIIVQLTNAGDDYPVSGMTVSIQKNSDSILTGVTGTDGKATIAVTEPGNYSVISVSGGIDASNLEVGSEGLEFSKPSPLIDPYPSLTYTFVVSVPVTSVTASGDYSVNAEIPSLVKVTVLAVGTLSTKLKQANLSVGTGAFPARIILSNISVNDQYAGLAINSNGTNSLLAYLNQIGTDPVIRTASFYNNSTSTYVSLGSLDNYVASGAIYFEVPGNGDWAMGYDKSSTNIKTRAGIGAGNFPEFNASRIMSLWNTLGNNASVNYSINYRILGFSSL